MNEYFGKVGRQITDFLKTLSPGRKMAMFVTALGIVAGLIVMALWASTSTYVNLMTNLSPEDATNIQRVLREKHIPFTVDPTGRSISIPPERIYDLRLELATMGLPQSSVVGYEVFDKQMLGATSFVQKVNEKRAREGELMRTINTIKGVKRSRVHLALPQKSTFIEDQKKATASVVLDLDAGTILAEKQIYGIGNLVSRAVEGMDINDVVIMDSSGKVLSKNTADPLAAATATQLDFTRKIETEVETRIEKMLAPIVGEGKVVAKVTADLDFSQVSETQTLYDPDSTAVRSTETRRDAMNGTRPGPYGLAGQQSNQPNTPPAANGEVKYDTTKANEVTNYEVPQTVRRTTKPQGSIKRLSVAVVVDGKTIKTAGKDGVVQSKVDAWPAEKIKEFEALVATAAGIDKKRGDTLEIKNLEFTHGDFEEAQKLIEDRERRSYVQNLLIYGVIGVIILLFFLFVVRPFIKWVTENTIDSVDSFLPQTIEELEKMQKAQGLPGMEDAVPVLPDNMDPAKVEGEMIKEKIISLVDANPHKAALILRDWLHAQQSRAAPPAGGDKDKGKSASA